MHAAHNAGNIGKDLPRDVLEATVEACRKKYGHYPNVIGIGSGLKLTKGHVLLNKDEEIDTTPCIHFYVRHKVRDVPSGSRLPRFVYARTAEGTVDRTWRIPTDVVNIGSPQFSQKSGTAIFPTGKSGAITILFQNEAQSRHLSYLVTCAHVVGNLMQSPPVDPIICDQSGAHLAMTIANATTVQGAMSYDIALARLLLTARREIIWELKERQRRSTVFCHMPGFAPDCRLTVLSLYPTC